MIVKRNRDMHYRELALYYKNRAKLRKFRAAVHLESNFDKVFWQRVFQHVLPASTFDYITYSRTIGGNKATGCQVCLKYHRLGCLSKDFFICIDSDYRYLLEEKDIDADHFILQTYTYSLENHYCYPPNIELVFSKLGLKNTLFDFDSFLRRYSRTLYSLFIYHLHSLSKDDGIFPTSGSEGFNTYLKVANTNQDEETILSDLRARVDSKLLKLQKLYPEVNMDALKQKYETLGLKEENAYLYFRGHHVLEQTVQRIMKDVRLRLETNRTQVYSSAKKKAYYSHEQRDSIGKYMMKAIHFDMYPEISKIERDIDRIFTNQQKK